MNQPQIGVQMYTLRDPAEKDFVGTLERVSQMGFAGVEFAGYFDLKAKDLKAVLERLNLAPAGSHRSYDQLLGELEEHTDYALELGLTHLICPYARFDTDAEWLDLAARLETVAQTLKKSGITLSYHNHDHELTQKIGGQTVLDAILEAAPNMSAELDVAWLEVGGYSAAEYLNKYAARAHLVHLKDYGRDGDKVNTLELGRGLVALPSALEAGKGAQWWLIEQDYCAGDPFDSLQISLEWLKANWS